MVAEGLPAQLACRVLDVSESGFYAWRSRPLSERAIRHAWLTDLIGQIHVDFRGVYGYRRVHAELTLGHGLTVGAEAVWLLMRKAGLQGLSGRPKYRRIPNQPTAGDLVDRDFARSDPDRLWVTDITEHPTREGKVYCAVVLDVFSRRVVGWSIDSTQNAALVTKALGVAIGQRNPSDETVIHSDQGTQGELNPAVATPRAWRWCVGRPRVGRRLRRDGGRCGRRDGLRAGGGSTCWASGKRSRLGSRVRMRRGRSACHPRLAAVGSVRVAGCEPSRVARSRAATCASRNGRRSQSCGRRVTAFVRSPAV